MAWAKSKKEPLQTAAEAYDFVLTKLNYRDYSEQELRAKLQERGCPEEIVNATLQKVSSYDFVNDARYAQRVYAAWLAKKYYGSKHLRQELYKHKLSSELITTIVASLPQEEEERRATRFVEQALTKKKFATPTPKARAALARALAARGFGEDIIYRVLEHAYA